MIAAAVFSLTFLGTVLGMLLGYAGRVFKVEVNPVVADLEAMLPGSQCGQCGFPGCAPAANALASGQATVTLCPPGGPALAQKLADKLGVVADISKMASSRQQLARVREEVCIGCTRCYKVCPTDAIVGGPKQIHTVIDDACTGCGNCVDICPTECLSLVNFEITLRNWRWQAPDLQASWR